MRRLSLVLACILAVSVTGCAQPRQPGASTVVKGSVRSAYGPGYPSDSTLVVRIVDPLSSVAVPFSESRKAIVPGWEIAGTQNEVDFEVAYDPKGVDPSRPYVVEAVVKDPGGKVVAVSTDSPRAITQGAPTSGIELTLASPSDVESGSPNWETTPTP